MSTSIEVFAKVQDYVDRRITLHELESWLVNRLPTYLSNPNSAAAELVGVIELGLAEIQAGIRSERSFRKLLGLQTTSNPISTKPYPYYTRITEASSSASPAEPTPLVWEVPSVSSSTVPQVEYV
jgi:hypothetical protein